MSDKIKAALERVIAGAKAHYSDLHYDEYKQCEQDCLDLRVTLLTAPPSTDGALDKGNKIGSGEVNLLPNGIRDECTYGDVAEALRSAGAPSFQNGKWLSLPERIAALTDEWQPIETAPKDGSPVLIFVPSTGICMYVAWNRNGNWMVFDTGKGHSAHVDATHWRPLPPPPALEKGDKG